jgi:hypothetical protein
VAQVTVAFRRLLLKGILWDAQEQGVLLAEALKAACRAKYVATNTGANLIGASGNGSSVTFSLPQEASTLTPSAVAEACSELDDLYAEVRADLVTGGTAIPTDGQIYAEMLHNLAPRRSAYADRSGMQLE